MNILKLWIAVPISSARNDGVDSRLRGNDIRMDCFVASLAMTKNKNGLNDK
jgi:hypothetical protein